VPASPLLGATYVAGATGLWVIPNTESLADTTLLRPDVMFIASDPKEQRVDADDEQSKVERRGNAWCVSRVWLGGDESGYHACLSDQGFVEAGWFWAGGSTYDVEARLIREPRGLPGPAATQDRGAR
jgi:hypothetical protein